MQSCSGGVSREENRLYLAVISLALFPYICLSLGFDYVTLLARRQTRDTHTRQCALARAHTHIHTHALTLIITHNHSQVVCC